MKKSTILKIPAAAAAVSFGLGYFAFEEVMSSKPLVYPKIAAYVNKMYEKKNAAVVPDDPDAEKQHSEAENKVRENAEWFNAAEKEDFYMINRDSLRLHGIFIAADEPSDICVFCSHGYTSSGPGDFGCICKMWHDMGFNLFLVDHRCHGASEGKWIGFGYHEYQDCIEWLEYLSVRFGDNLKFILHGISMGSATVMMMSGADNLPESVKCTVADCGYTSCSDELKFGLREYLHLPPFPIFYTADIFSKLINGYHFDDASPIEAVSHTRVPIIFFHGGNDVFVPTENVYRLYDACSSPDKEIMVTDGAGHTESYRYNPSNYEKKCSDFIKKFI